MGHPSAEQFAQRIFNLNLVSARQMDAVWGELGTRSVTTEELCNMLLRKELLTNFQIDRVIAGEMAGYHYGNYKVLYLVGTGTFARVYRAANRLDQEVRAVKVLRKRFRDSLAEHEQFLREGEMGTALRHPNIVTIHEVGQERHTPYLVMDFVEGQNLRQFLRTRGKLAPEVALPLFRDIVTGLEHAHSKGITHRDLKLSNVLVTSNGRAKLLDFGLAAARSDMTENAIVDCPNPRTIDYAALERATGVRKDDPRSDVYFAGCILYHMLSGEPPLYETKDRLQRLNITRFQTITPLSQLVPELPSHLALLVARVMELDPEKRCPSPKALLAELKLSEQRISTGEVESVAAIKSEPAEKQKTIMVVESQEKMQNDVRKGLKKEGYRVLVYSDPERALARFPADEPPPADCVVFSSAELGEDAVDAFNRFGKFDRTKNIPAILLVNKKQKSLAEVTESASHRVALSLPVRFGELRTTLKNILGDGEATPT